MKEIKSKLMKQKDELEKSIMGKSSKGKSKALILLSLLDDEAAHRINRKTFSLAKEYSKSD